MPFLDNLKLLISSPPQFFEKVRDENIKPAFLAYAISLLIGLMVSYFQSQFLYSILAGGMPYGALYPNLGLFSFIFSIFQFIAAIAVTFGYSGIIYLLVKAFKGSGGYSDSFKAYAYSSVPANLLLIVPFIGFLGFIYSLVLMIIGVKTLHNISGGKAAMAVLLPIGIVVLLLFALVFGFTLFYFGQAF